MNDFFKTIRSYLQEYLSKQRCYSENTIKSYRYALNLLVEYLRGEKYLTLSQIDFSIFDRELVLGYLDWLETARHCSASTRNQRLMALHSFFNYAGVLDCAQISLCLEVKEIHVKKAPGRIVEFLSEDALKALLAQPGTKKRTDCRNQFFMTLMYETAARCDELLRMKVCDLRLNTRYPVANLVGKGDKPRSVALLSKAVEHCKQYLQMFHSDPGASENDFLFFTVIHGVKHAMSTDNAEAFMKKYGEEARLICPEVPVRVHPHQLRHTRAIHFYRDGMPLALLSEYLGHASVETTKIYAYADTEMKRAAMEKAEHLRKGAPVPEPIWKGDEDMILQLAGLK
jgi:site-specific recombinase XerD